MAYFELVLKDFISTGRVKFYSLCEYVGDDKFKSLVEKELEYKVVVRKKTVDSTYMDVQVRFSQKELKSLPKFTSENLKKKRLEEVISDIHSAHWSKGYPKNQTPFCIIFGLKKG